MIEPDLTLQKPLEDYVEHIDKLNMRSLLLLGEMFSPSCSFSDPYHNVKGADKAYKILEHRFNVCNEARYKAIDFMWGRREATAYIYWTFIYNQSKAGILRGKGETHSIDVMCEVKFLPDGKVYSHSEFWGAHDGFNVKNYGRIINPAK